MYLFICLFVFRAWSYICIPMSRIMLGTKDQRMANVEKNSYGERTELGHLIFTSISGSQRLFADCE